MLVLSRKKGEAISIGDGLVKVTVTEVRGGRVKIRVDAPKEITIRRKEVKENESAG